jgi:hypothetical protein
MPILAYFSVIGTILVVLLRLSSSALPDIGPPIKTSQLVGLPKVEPRPESEPLITTFNFAAPPKKNVDAQLPDTIYAKDTSALKRKNVPATKQRQPRRWPTLDANAWL